MKNVQKRNSSGFTLIETLVAITILVVSVSAPLTLAAKGLSSAYFARDQITAFYLAQEAVEIIRNMRDENILSGRGWTSGIPIGTPFIAEALTNTTEVCTGTCEYLKYNDETGFYNYTSGDASRYRRTVEVETVDSKEISISVTIDWQSGIFSRSFSIKENILNWQ